MSELYTLKGGLVLKKAYEKPEFDLIKFSVIDVLTQSITTTTPPVTAPEEDPTWIDDLPDD